MGVILAKEVGDNHEWPYVPELHLEWEMDFHNNHIGRSLYLANPIADGWKMKDLVLQAIQNGDCRYLKPVNHILSPSWVGIQECSYCLNGILPNTVMLPTNQ
jgi:hypothetical protein